MWEHRTWSPYGMNGSTFGVEYHGADGVVTTDGRTWSIHRPKEPPKPGFDGDTSYEPQHQRNWLDAIRGDAQLTADIDVGRMSACFVPRRQHFAAARAQADLGRGDGQVRGGGRRSQCAAGREYRAPWTLPDV